MAIIKKFRIKSFKKQDPILKIENVSVSFKKRPILDKISFNLNNGEILGLLGPNGVGKSTIFNLITGLLKPDFGIIKINNTNVLDFPIAERATKFKIGYVPQYGGYFHDLTLIENLKAIAEIQIEKPKDRNIKIDEIISRFEFDAVANLQAKFLSGGQKKKLVIALSLLSDPKVLLLDECFAALDVLTIKMLQGIIVNLQKESNITICICDHQARDLLACVDKAMILSNCKVVAEGSPQELVNNIDAKSAYFGDSFNFK